MLPMIISVIVIIMVTPIVSEAMIVARADAKPTRDMRTIGVADDATDHRSDGPTDRRTCCCAHETIAQTLLRLRSERHSGGAG
jgi:hypothetical protein